MDKDKIKQGIKLFIDGLNENPRRPGLNNTPQRFADFCEEAFYSYDQKPPEISTFSEKNATTTVSLEGITFVSFCEHHLVPFYGEIDITYIPANGKIAGFGSLSRVCSYFAARLQIQERLTSDIGNFLNDLLSPQYLNVEIRAQHFCMRLHGDKKENVIVKTNYKKGNDILLP